MTILGTEVVDRQTDLVAIDSVNPGLSPGGAGEAEIARYVRDWAQMQGLRVELVDAIVKTGPVLVALQELGRTLAGRAHALLGPGVVHAGLISGGQETSTIPERCVLTVERRTLPGETVDDEWVSLADTVEWMREAGLAVRVDRIGNVYAERAGDDPTLPCVLMGSHIDTVATGGARAIRSAARHRRQPHPLPGTDQRHPVRGGADRRPAQPRRRPHDRRGEAPRRVRR